MEALEGEGALKWKIEVSLKPDIPDAIGLGIAQDIEDIGITGVQQVRTAHIYWLEGEPREEEVNDICENLLVDAVTQRYSFKKGKRENGKTRLHEVDESEPSLREASVYEVVVSFKPGVTDAVGESVMKGIRDLGIRSISSAQTGQKYVITGEPEYNQVEDISRRLLANDVIQSFEIEERKENT